MEPIAAKIIDIIDAHRTDIIAFAKDIAQHPESGFFETRTAEKISAALQSCGLAPQTKLARTGVKAVLGSAQPRVAVIAELDGVCCPQHLEADPDTGVAHACGHNLQLGALYGAALALTVPEIAQALCGSVAFIAVPAEEYVRADIQATLRETDGIAFCCGKSELIRIGAFEDIDLALTTHVHMIDCAADVLLGNNACNGFVIKTVILHGKAAHAAAAPDKGVNALNAAALVLSAIGMLRETFREDDTVRIHTNILKGGTALNVVPDTVEIEAQIRAANLNALRDAAEKFDRACTHCAAALGAKAEIKTHQGYMPVRPMAAEAAGSLAAADLNVTAQNVNVGAHNMASTDVGDLTQILPVINFTHSGVAGGLHSADFCVTDEEKAYVLPAKMFALTVYHLLKNHAEIANNNRKSFVPAMTRQEYITRIEAEK